MHAQGQVALVDPKRHDLTPWAEVDLERWREPVTKALREGGELSATGCLTSCSAASLTGWRPSVANGIVPSV